MGISKVIINFSRSNYTDLELIAKAGYIEEHIGGNAQFMTPVPPLPVLNAAKLSFIEAVTKAEDGSKEDTSLKNSARLYVENVLKQLGEYVQTTSVGEESIILSSGYDIHKKAAPIGPLEQAMGLVVRYGINTGEVTLECNVIKNALMYNFEYTDASIAPVTNWISNMTTKRQINLNGLTSGKYYEFRVAGLNSDPSRNWSERVRKLIV